jgi:hypothetical protein
LTVAKERLAKRTSEHGKEVSIHLLGQEINPENLRRRAAGLTSFLPAGP